MNIIEQNKEKINGILETFDRMIINGYSLNLCNYRHFLYYFIAYFLILSIGNFCIDIFRYILFISFIFISLSSSIVLEGLSVYESHGLFGLLSVGSQFLQASFSDIFCASGFPKRSWI